MIKSFLEEYVKLKNDKMIIFIIMIIPLVVNLLIGWELSKDVITNIPMAVLDKDNSELSRQIIKYFSDNETFNIIYAQNEEELEEWIHKSKVRAGMIIPKKFSSDVVTLKSPTILLLYDGSHMSIASTAKTIASEILLTIKTGAEMKQIQSRLNMTENQSYNVAMPISFSSRILYNPTKSFNNFLTPGLGMAICQIGIALTAVLSIIYEDKNNIKYVSGYLLGKIVFYALLGTISLMLAIFLQIYIIKIPFKGSFLEAFILSLFLALAVSSLAILVSTLIENRVIAIVVVGVLIIPNTIMAGYTWPVLSMSKSYSFLAWFIPFYHFADNIRNLFLKGTLNNLMGDIAFLFIFSLIMYGLSVLGIMLKASFRRKDKNETII
ncbi:ABC transporter permease [Defluviitalea phaphyphila]|uniref:ABC transporter permease n=1 Tax=Defluviitalea phaphyphila TaxID=1473580 RepID=UPI00072FA296|nr:ABC transporter permease [Defluviitalea phaphyphila]